MGMVMPLFRRTKAAPKLSNPVNSEVWGDTLKRSEQLARYYGNNPEAMQLLSHVFGEAAICARMNAKICDSATLRLYKRAGAGGDRKGTRGRKIGGEAREAMQKGRYGRKLAEFTLGGAEMVEVTSHPALDLARNPNWLYPGNEVNVLGWMFRWTVGNSYDQVTFSGSTPVQLYPMYAQHVNIVANDETGIEAYVYGRSENSWHPYQPNEVIHYKLEPSMHTPLYGTCPLHDVLPYVDQLRDSVILDIAMTKNGMRPDMIVSLPEGTGQDQEETFIKRLTNKFGTTGVRSWTKPLVVTGETKVQQLTWAEKEAMSLPKREEATKMVRRAYGHDEAQADSSDATYAAALMGDARFLGQHIEPALQQDAAQKSKLLRMFGYDPDVYAFAYDPMVEKDEAVFAERLRADWLGGVRTVNEVRVEMGLEELPDENADKLMVNGVPIGSSAQPDPFGGLLGSFGGSRGDQQSAAGDDEPSPPGSGDDEPEAPEPKAFDFKSLLTTHESDLWRPCNCAAHTKDDDDIASTSLLRDALEKYRGTLQPLARDVVADMQEDAIEAIGNGRKPDLSPIIDQAAPQFRDALEDVVRFGITNMLDDTGSGGLLEGVTVPDEAFNIAPERALRALDAYSFELAGELAETTVNMAETAVRNGVENGLSIREIAKEMEGFPEYRAEAIARTETSRAMNAGAHAGMVAVGVQKRKVLTAPGVRKSHAAIAAQGAVPVDEPLVKAGETFGGETFNRDIMHPPLGINCRCAEVPVFDEDES